MGLDLDARTPGAWGVVASLVAIHIVSGVWWMSTGEVDVWGAMAASRSIPFRVAVGGQYGPLVWSGEVWRLFTSVALHADALHLAVNAVSLVALGRMLEPWVGTWRWLALFWAGGVAGSLTSHGVGLLQSDGASGGGLALVGAAAVLGWRHRHDLIPEDRRLYGPILWAFIALNAALSLALPFVDAAGHSGGFVAGVLLGWLPRPERDWPSRLVVGACVAICAWGWVTGVVAR